MLSLRWFPAFPLTEDVPAFLDSLSSKVKLQGEGDQRNAVLYNMSLLKWKTIPNEYQTSKSWKSCFNFGLKIPVYGGTSPQNIT